MNYRAQGLRLAFAIHETEFILTVSQMLFSAFGTKKCTKTPVNWLASNMNTLCLKVLFMCANWVYRTRDTRPSAGCVQRSNMSLSCSSLVAFFSDSQHTVPLLCPCDQDAIDLFAPPPPPTPASYERSVGTSLRKNAPFMFCSTP